MNLSELGEFGLIADLQNRLFTRTGVQLGIGDDAAVLSALQCPIVTCDALVEGIHFRRDWTTPRALGRKAMAVNISDLAAMGAEPVAAFVSLAAGPNDSVEWIRELYAGFESMAHEYRFTIAGGDTVKSLGATMISVTLIGEVYNRERGPVLRSGAQAGDMLMVTNTLGDSAAGLALLFNDEAQVRQAEMRALLNDFPNDWHAALDLSDGLVGDAAHMAKRSGVSIEINVEKLPISPACREVAQALGIDPVDWALSGGEDYELLVAVNPERAEEMAEIIEDYCDDETLTVIGRCTAANEDGPQVIVQQNGVSRSTQSAWSHF
ncbi:thiamine-phosphate kinase [bacterium]|nr:MAG: thiamine-phosphate kinase [bacterium]